MGDAGAGRESRGRPQVASWFCGGGRRAVDGGYRRWYGLLTLDAVMLNYK